MPFTIDGIIPWGRTMAEYCGMFDLGERDLRGRILGCGYRFSVVSRCGGIEDALYD